MPLFPSKVMRRNRAAFVCSLVAILLAMLPDSDAQNSSPNRRDKFTTPYQPFSFNVASADRRPITSATNREDAAPRAIRVAYNLSQPAPIAVPRAEPVNDYDDERESQPVGTVAVEPERRESRPMVPGNRAVLRNGIAYAPARAPDRVKAAIWAANALRHKPYEWGGGHGSFNDDGYDCSGSVSFALHGGSLLPTPLPSNDFMRYGQRGRGRWITIYSRPGHTFAVIAGLRFDTTDFRYGDVGPRWHADRRDTRGFVARHPAGA